MNDRNSFQLLLKKSKLVVLTSANDVLNTDNKFLFLDNLANYKGNFLNFLFVDTPLMNKFHIFILNFTILKIKNNSLFGKNLLSVKNPRRGFFTERKSKLILICYFPISIWEGSFKIISGRPLYFLISPLILACFPK